MSERIRYELLLTGLSLVIPMGGCGRGSRIFFTGSMLEEPYLCCCMNRMTEAFGFMP